MMIKDVMPSFELFQPTQLRDAFALLDRYGKDSWKMAGGYDSLSWFKERAKRPKAVIDLSGIAEMKGIRETADGIEIGALTTLTEIERHPQHLLCGYPAGRQPRARAVRERSLRRRIAVRRGASPGRARRQVRDQKRQGRARHQHR